mmetsp:Transcript_20422/g.63485  ORF Transcript_20422/g.63485 Transcript_20422/m.63485 type:complete len:263 (-) Transcript_20422:218-1006(-)
MAVPGRLPLGRRKLHRWQARRAPCCCRRSRRAGSASAMAWEKHHPLAARRSPPRCYHRHRPHRRSACRSPQRPAAFRRVHRRPNRSTMPPLSTTSSTTNLSAARALRLRSRLCRRIRSLPDLASGEAIATKAERRRARAWPQSAWLQSAWLQSGWPQSAPLLRRYPRRWLTALPSSPARRLLSMWQAPESKAFAPLPFSGLLFGASSTSPAWTLGKSVQQILQSARLVPCRPPVVRLAVPSVAVAVAMRALALTALPSTFVW